MELKSIIEECAKRKIQLWIENGKLHFRSPVGVFDEKLKQNIKVNKDAIIEYLNRKERKKLPSSLFKWFNYCFTCKVRQKCNFIFSF